MRWLLPLMAAAIINGQITAVDGNNVTLQTCTGVVQVDASAAIAAEKSVQLTVGSYVGVNGDLNGSNMAATAIWNKRILCPQ